MPLATLGSSPMFWGGSPVVWGSESAWQPTSDQILNLDGVRRRVDRFRFELCDQDLVPIGELHPDRGENIQIQNDSANNTSRRLSGFKLLPDEVPDVNPLTDRLRVYMVLQNGVEHRLGTFLWGDANNPVRSWGEEQHSDLVDFGYILDQETTQAYGWGRGATIGIVMFFLLFRAGFELADVAVIGREADRSLPEPKSWEPGATWLQMLTDLGEIVGFAPPWFDRDGRVHIDQMPDPEVDRATVPDLDGRVVADSILRSSGMLSAPNEFAVFDSGTDRLRLGRYQVPASAPHSFARRGFRIGRSESSQGIPGQAMADRRAKNLARREGVAHEELSVQTTLDPRFETHAIVPAFDHTWLSTSFTMNLRSGGLMGHTMRRTAYAIN